MKHSIRNYSISEIEFILMNKTYLLEDKCVFLTRLLSEEPLWNLKKILKAMKIIAKGK